MTLEYFSDPELLSHVYRDLLTRLLDDYKEHLPAEAAALRRADLNFEQFCAAWAAQFQDPSRFGLPLRDALLAIEKLARPENESLLKEALSHLPPGYVVNQNFPSLHQALHLWIIAQNTPGVSFPLAAQASACSNSQTEPALGNHQSPIANSLGSPTSTPINPSSIVDSPSSPIAAGDTAPAPPIAAGDTGPAPAPSPVGNHQSPIANPTASQINQSSTLNPPPSSPHGLSDDLRRLALLSPIEYDLVRRAEAKRLNLRLSTLDDAVERARILEDDAQANALKLPQLEPWPEPITDAPA